MTLVPACWCSPKLVPATDHFGRAFPITSADAKDHFWWHLPVMTLTYALYHIRWRLPALALILLFTIPVYSFSRPAQSGKGFRQEVNHRIDVTLDDVRHQLSAYQETRYINNSPDTLDILYFHLWTNAWSGNDTPLARQLLRFDGQKPLFDDPSIGGFIDSLDFSVNNLTARWELLSGRPDICRIYLDEPAAPGDTLLISTPFRVKIPYGGTSRLGHIGQSYQVANWYPKPALYDEKGWHSVSYRHMAELPSEYAGYTVDITLPANYVTGATGTLQTAGEIMWLNRLATDTTWMLIHYFAGTRFPLSLEQTKTIRFTAEKAKEFAWFADKRFNVMQDTVVLESGKDVTVRFMFTNLQAGFWQEVPNYVNDALIYFSSKLGDYPFDEYTVTQSVLGAEEGWGTPGASVIGFSSSAYSLQRSVALDLVRNWTYASSPGSTGMSFPFMAEGIAGVYVNHYMTEYGHERQLWESYFRSSRTARWFNMDGIPESRTDELNWLERERLSHVVPMDAPADDYMSREYVLDNYYRAAGRVDYLKAWMGDSLFDFAMQLFYRNLQFSHPGTGDMQDLFEFVSGSDLGWFFDDFSGTPRRLDYGVVRYGGGQALVENRAELASPVKIAGLSGDSVQFEKWVDGFHGRQWIPVPPGAYDRIMINPDGSMPEVRKTNNNVRTAGIFPAADLPRMKFLYAVDDPAYNTLVYIPLVNWTRENGVMPGVMLHNGMPLPKPAEFILTPFYSFRDNSFAGSGRFLFNKAPYNTFLNLATISLEGSRFGAPGIGSYHAFRAGTDLFLGSYPVGSMTGHRLFGRFILVSDLYALLEQGRGGNNTFWQFGYVLERQTRINPFSLGATIETHRLFQKASLEFNYRQSYKRTGGGLDMRILAGYMLNNDSPVPFHALAPAGRGGREQYLFHGNYPDRFTPFSESFFSRQTTFTEGGLVSPVNDLLGYCDWLISLSLSSTIPGLPEWVPVRPFVNSLLTDPSPVRGNRIHYEAGLKAGIWGLFEVYFPLLVSPGIGAETGSTGGRIRFVLHLDSFSKPDFIGIWD